MTIISCENCGIVIDTDRIPKLDMFDGNDEIIPSRAIWDGETYLPAINCPNCNDKIYRSNGNNP